MTTRPGPILDPTTDPSAPFILLVDENPVVCSLLSSVFVLNGLRAHCTTSIDDARHIAAAEMPSILVVDSALICSSSGEAWVRQFQRRASKHVRVSIVVLTDQPGQELIEGAPRLAKPVDADELIRVVSNALLPPLPSFYHPVFAVEIGKDWIRGNRGRHVVREFADRESAEAYLARLEIPSGWCGAVVEVESSPEMFLLGMRPVRTLLVRHGGLA